jgi:hypothetical protein
MTLRHPFSARNPKSGIEGTHAKPCGILNVMGFYSPLLATFDHAGGERFL